MSLRSTGAPWSGRAWLVITLPCPATSTTQIPRWKRGNEEIPPVITTRPETFGAIVVGSGAGGGFAAMGLAEAGMRVLLLERGRRFEPRRDFPMNHPDWELRLAFGKERGLR